MKHPKGTVVVCTRGQCLAIRLPRYLFGGEQKYIYLGVPDTPTNRQSAIARSQVISTDIASDNFDYTLEKYLPAILNSTSPDMADLWQKYTDFKRKILASSTIEKDYDRIAFHISTLPTGKVRDAMAIRRFLLNNLSVATVKRVLMYLAACCQWAVEEKIIQVNPFKELPKLKSKKSSIIDPFTKAERDQIIKAFQVSRYYKYYQGFVQFLFFTGCRTGEAVGLKWEHICLESRTITFKESFSHGEERPTKTGTIRRFPINDQLKDLLLTVKSQSVGTNLVFPSVTGKHIDAHNFLNKAWKSTMDTLPVRYRSQYNTRHTFITLCLEADIPVAQVASWVGNSPSTIYRHYAGIVSSFDVPTL